MEFVLARQILMANSVSHAKLGSMTTLIATVSFHIFCAVAVMLHILFVFYFPDCNCDSIGSLNFPYCNPKGNCFCKANVNGTNCDVCNNGYYNLQSGDGCILCNCNNLGSMNATCHIQTGQCFCKPGYVGIQCDQCQDGYFGDPNGLQSSNQPCQECNCNNNIDKNATGNCDTLSGKCLNCINFTSGFNCETCEDGYYGDATTGNYPKCNICTCNAYGTNDNCDNYKGEIIFHTLFIRCLTTIKMISMMKMKCTKKTGLKLRNFLTKAI